MALNFGIKVTRPGYSTTTTDPRQMLMSSAYQMFKYHGEYTTSAVFNPGDKTVTASVTHNLGYVPAFMAYGVRSDDSANFIIPSIPYATSEFDWGEAWADTTKIYFKVTLFPGYGAKEAGWNELVISATDYYCNVGGVEDGTIWLGNYSGSGRNGAVRFDSVPLTSGETITYAKIQIYTNNKAGSTALHMRWHNYGIDEDDTASFGDPFGRSKTTATNDQDRTVPTNLGDYVEIEAQSMVNEIRQRAGWSSGNAMGFTMIDNGSDSDGWMLDSEPPDSYLNILKSGTLTVNFRAIVFKDKIAT